MNDTLELNKDYFIQGVRIFQQNLSKEFYVPHCHVSKDYVIGLDSRNYSDAKVNLKLQNKADDLRDNSKPGKINQRYSASFGRGESYRNDCKRRDTDRERSHCQVSIVADKRHGSDADSYSSTHEVLVNNLEEAQCSHSNESPSETHLLPSQNQFSYCPSYYRGSDTASPVPVENNSMQNVEQVVGFKVVAPFPRLESTAFSQIRTIPAFPSSVGTGQTVCPTSADPCCDVSETDQAPSLVTEEQKKGSNPRLVKMGKHEKERGSSQSLTAATPCTLTVPSLSQCNQMHAKLHAKQSIFQHNVEEQEQLHVIPTVICAYSAEEQAVHSIKESPLPDSCMHAGQEGSYSDFMNLSTKTTTGNSLNESIGDERKADGKEKSGFRYDQESDVCQFVNKRVVDDKVESKDVSTGWSPTQTKASPARCRVSVCGARSGGGKDYDKYTKKGKLMRVKDHEKGRQVKCVMVKRLVKTNRWRQKQTILLKKQMNHGPWERSPATCTCTSQPHKASVENTPVRVYEVKKQHKKTACHNKKTKGMEGNWLNKDSPNTCICTSPMCLRGKSNAVCGKRWQNLTSSWKRRKKKTIVKMGVSSSYYRKPKAGDKASHTTINHVSQTPQKCVCSKVTKFPNWKQRKKQGSIVKIYRRPNQGDKTSPSTFTRSCTVWSAFCKTPIDNMVLRKWFSTLIYNPNIALIRLLKEYIKRVHVSFSYHQASIPCPIGEAGDKGFPTTTTYRSSAHKSSVENTPVSVKQCRKKRACCNKEGRMKEGKWPESVLAKQSSTTGLHISPTCKASSRSENKSCKDKVQQNSRSSCNGLKKRANVRMGVQSHRSPEAGNNKLPTNTCIKIKRRQMWTSLPKKMKSRCKKVVSSKIPNETTIFPAHKASAENTPIKTKGLQKIESMCKRRKKNRPWRNKKARGKEGVCALTKESLATCVPVCLKGENNAAMDSSNKTPVQDSAHKASAEQAQVKVNGPQKSPAHRSSAGTISLRVKIWQNVKKLCKLHKKNRTLVKMYFDSLRYCRLCHNREIRDERSRTTHISLAQEESFGSNMYNSQKSAWKRRKKKSYEQWSVLSQCQCSSSSNAVIDRETFKPSLPSTPEVLTSQAYDLCLGKQGQIEKDYCRLCHNREICDERSPTLCTHTSLAPKASFGNNIMHNTQKSSWKRRKKKSYKQCDIPSQCQRPSGVNKVIDCETFKPSLPSTPDVPTSQAYDWCLGKRKIKGKIETNFTIQVSRGDDPPRKKQEPIHFYNESSATSYGAVEDEVVHTEPLECSAGHTIRQNTDSAVGKSSGTPLSSEYKSMLSTGAISRHHSCDKKSISPSYEAPLQATVDSQHGSSSVGANSQGSPSVVAYEQTETFSNGVEKVVAVNYASNQSVYCSLVCSSSAAIKLREELVQKTTDVQAAPNHCVSNPFTSSTVLSDIHVLLISPHNGSSIVVCPFGGVDEETQTSGAAIPHEQVIGINALSLPLQFKVETLAQHSSLLDMKTLTKHSSLPDVNHKSCNIVPHGNYIITNHPSQLEGNVLANTMPSTNAKYFYSLAEEEVRDEQCDYSEKKEPHTLALVKDIVHDALVSTTDAKYFYSLAEEELQDEQCDYSEEKESHTSLFDENHTHCAHKASVEQAPVKVNGQPKWKRRVCINKEAGDNESQTTCTHLYPTCKTSFGVENNAVKNQMQQCLRKRWKKRTDAIIDIGHSSYQKRAAYNGKGAARTFTCESPSHRSSAGTIRLSLRIKIWQEIKRLCKWRKKKGTLVKMYFDILHYCRLCHNREIRDERSHTTHITLAREESFGNNIYNSQKSAWKRRKKKSEQCSVPSQSQCSSCSNAVIDRETFKPSLSSTPEVPTSQAYDWCLGKRKIKGKIEKDFVIQVSRGDNPPRKKQEPIHFYSGSATSYGAVEDEVVHTEPVGCSAGHTIRQTTDSAVGKSSRTPLSSECKSMPSTGSISHNYSESISPSYETPLQATVDTQHAYCVSSSVGANSHSSPPAVACEQTETFSNGVEEVVAVNDATNQSVYLSPVSSSCGSTKLREEPVQKTADTSNYCVTNLSTFNTVLSDTQLPLISPHKCSSIVVCPFGGVYEETQTSGVAILQEQVIGIDALSLPLQLKVETLAQHSSLLDVKTLTKHSSLPDVNHESCNVVLHGNYFITNHPSQLEGNALANTMPSTNAKYFYSLAEEEVRDEQCDYSEKKEPHTLALDKDLVHDALVSTTDAKYFYSLPEEELRDKYDYSGENGTHTLLFDENCAHCAHKASVEQAPVKVNGQPKQKRRVCVNKEAGDNESQTTCTHLYPTCKTSFGVENNVKNQMQQCLRKRWKKRTGAIIDISHSSYQKRAAYNGKGAARTFTCESPSHRSSAGTIRLRIKIWQEIKRLCKWRKKKGTLVKICFDSLCYCRLCHNREIRDGRSLTTHISLAEEESFGNNIMYNSQKSARERRKKKSSNVVYHHNVSAPPTQHAYCVSSSVGANSHSSPSAVACEQTETFSKGVEEVVAVNDATNQSVYLSPVSSSSGGTKFREEPIQKTADTQAISNYCVSNLSTFNTVLSDTQLPLISACNGSSIVVCASGGVHAETQTHEQVIGIDAMSLPLQFKVETLVTHSSLTLAKHSSLLDVNHESCGIVPNGNYCITNHPSLLEVNITIPNEKYFSSIEEEVRDEECDCSDRKETHTSPSDKNNYVHDALIPTTNFYSLAEEEVRDEQCDYSEKKEPSTSLLDENYVNDALHTSIPDSIRKYVEPVSSHCVL